jgi:hypothetical protein
MNISLDICSFANTISQLDGGTIFLENNNANISLFTCSFANTLS